MPKNIVILLDGTSNRISASRTNILRLYGTLEKSERQLVYYDPGVGTFGADNAWFGLWRKMVEIWGLLTGWGLDYNVKEAYRFLVENYDSAGGDRIYLFGFSRGAYSARVLAGFIHAIGLMEPRNLNLIDYAYRAYKGIDEDKCSSSGEAHLYDRVLRANHPAIRLLGLFDTVASIIEYGTIGVRLRSHAYTKGNPSVATIRQALAIDERRTMFQPQLWRPGETMQDASEVWFAGAHSDVGGGNPEAESGLAKIALQWMIEQTRATGLLYDAAAIEELVLGVNPGKHAIGPDETAAMHNSMTLGWALAEFIPRRRAKGSKKFNLFGWTIPLFEGRALPAGARIHRSVILRREKGIGHPVRLPPDYVVEDPQPGPPPNLL